jgi:hypothetical protein
MPTIPYKTKSGKRVKGVTTIISQNLAWGKEPLLHWANKQGLEGKTLAEARDTATVSGTIAHYLIECHLKNKTPELLGYAQEDIGKAETAFLNFLEWWDNWKPEIVAIEPNLVDDILGFGGTPDLLCNIKGRLQIVDWKSGKIYESSLIQLAAYSILCEYNGYGTVLGFHILRIPKNEEIPSFTHRYWGALGKDAYLAFEYLRQLDGMQKRLKEII